MINEFTSTVTAYSTENHVSDACPPFPTLAPHYGIQWKKGCESRGADSRGSKQIVDGGQAVSLFSALYRFTPTHRSPRFIAAPHVTVVDRSQSTPDDGNREPGRLRYTWYYATAQYAHSLTDLDLDLPACPRSPALPVACALRPALAGWLAGRRSL
ncbi:hypothetical protein AXG93_312s1030 [Marchantia polymorpha subsp. ruderalis]|uniref:Uncharacterized protein n=1 Tax=Marchantia polymorpha subsp. ruderalis TaxID=1480154 RepID=A0A176W6Q6_MARPO|nr:hypothetical protein AXG93_312s1030 [Marchantia polymorpha subsp. ruderalis]